MATIWRAKCAHRDVRVNQSEGPVWSPCLKVGCNATWVRYEVSESVVWGIGEPNRKPYDMRETRGEALERQGDLMRKFNWAAAFVISRHVRRTLRRSRS